MMEDRPTDSALFPVVGCWNCALLGRPVLEPVGDVAVSQLQAGELRALPVELLDGQDAVEVAGDRDAPLLERDGVGDENETDEDDSSGETGARKPGTAAGSQDRAQTPETPRERERHDDERQSAGARACR